MEFDQSYFLGTVYYFTITCGRSICNGAGLRVSESFTGLKFNGCDCVDAMISGPTGLARMLSGVLAWWMSICIGDTGKMPVSTLGLVGRAGRRTPCARESCNSDSSPEPSAA
jgi:hypothetical protein